MHIHGQYLEELELEQSMAENTGSEIKLLLQTAGAYLGGNEEEL